MGQTDKAIRRLVDLSQAGLVISLLQPAEVQILGTEPSELQVIERVTDKVVRAHVNGVETIINVEFQATHEPRFPARLLTYQALLRHRYFPRPVRSIAVYLMHEAPHHGVPRCITPSPDDPQLTFSYDLFCAWEQPITLEQVRKNPHLGPLATLTPGVVAEDLIGLQRIIERAEEPRVVRGELLALTYILASRRFDRALLESLLRSNIMLEDSPGYQELIARGQAQGREIGEKIGKKIGKEIGEEIGREIGREIGEARALRRTVTQLARHRLGAVPAGLPEQLETLDVGELNALFNRVLEAQDTSTIEAALTSLRSDD